MSSSTVYQKKDGSWSFKYDPYDIDDTEQRVQTVAKGSEAKMNTKSDHISELRQSLERDRDLIDQKLALLDQYEKLGCSDIGFAPPISQKPLKFVGSKKEPKKRKKVVARRKKATKPVVPKKSPRSISKSVLVDYMPPTQRAKRGQAKKRLIDQPQTPCGGGKLTFTEGSNMDKVIAIIESLSPHWTTHDGIAEAARATHLTLPASFHAIAVSVCARLRKGKHAVLGLEYRIINRRVEYRITKRTTVRKED